jgi:hypothetical protein
MNKAKLLIVLPYGMCIRQIVLNHTLWNYLTQTYQVDVMTSLEISDDITGIHKVIDTHPANFFEKFFKRISGRSTASLRASQMVNFFMDNNIGENFALRWKWFGDQARHILVMSGLVKLKFIGSLIKNSLTFFSKLYPVFFLRRNKYDLIIVTHVSDLDCTMIGLGANNLSIPLISITLGLDNYAHGPMLYSPNLMLLWGNEQLEEFNKYHLPHNKKLLNTECHKIGSLIHDNYLQIKKSENIDYLSENHLFDANQKFIVVAVMLEEVLPNQTALCELIIDFLEEKNLEHKLLIRKLPQTDKEIWQEFYEKHSDRVIIQEPQSASFDKRSDSLKFDVNSSKRDLVEFVQTLDKSDLIIGLYPSTLLLDAMLFNRQTAVAMFDWTNEKDYGGHPQEKFYLAKQYTHYHRRHYNFLYSKQKLHNFMIDVLIKGIRFPEERREIFLKITGDSIDGSSGRKAVDAIDAFLKKH